MSIMTARPVARKSNVTDDSLESAWELGHEIGLRGVKASGETVYSDRERAAFGLGNALGLREHRIAVEEYAAGYDDDDDALVSPSDRAWDLGYNLGESGYETRDVVTPSGFDRDETSAFNRGMEAGIAARWADYERWSAEREVLDFAAYEPEEHERSEMGSCLGHAG